MNTGELQPILNRFSFQVNGLLRKYKVPGGANEETIKTAYDRQGEPFMMELLQIITPEKQESGFWGLFEGKSKAKTAMNSTTPEEDANATLDAMINADSSSSATGTTSNGGFWKFFDNVLTTVDRTGKTIGDFKANTTNQPTAEQQAAQVQAAQATASNNKLIYWIGGGLIAVIVIILILRKND